MNSQRKPLKNAIKSFYESQLLTDHQLQQLNTLQSKLMPSNASLKQRLSKHLRTSWLQHNVQLAALAASLLMAVLLISYLQQPMIISAAYADILKDATLSHGLQEAQQQWMHSNQIAPVPEQYTVEMSKFCQLNDSKTTHLRIAGKQQGHVNVFLHVGDHPYLWGKTTGRTDDGYWKVLRARDKLTLIVMYSHDMREEAVTEIINTMVPGVVS